jgi:hypothetical protein
MLATWTAEAERVSLGSDDSGPYGRSCVRQPPENPPVHRPNNPQRVNQVSANRHQIGNDRSCASSKGPISTHRGHASAHRSSIDEETTKILRTAGRSSRRVAARRRLQAGAQVALGTLLNAVWLAAFRRFGVTNSAMTMFAGRTN